MSNLARHPLWRQAVQDFIAEFAYGEIVGHDWLEAHFGMPGLSEDDQLTADQFRERQFEWLANVEAFKVELLRDHQICLQSIRGKGYRWVPPNEQTDLAVADFQRSAKKIFGSVGQKLRQVRAGELTDTERKANVDAVAKLSALQGMTRSALN
ncbi:hypothetical protein [Pseudomonas lundensis]|uniref:hypothetical protein n=1 Tax=Pseudomonas lundensis TaxID=86185 RepID=UPI00089DA8CB|nr:hypothetical protein [Pseudomonas lundensis]